MTPKPFTHNPKAKLEKMARAANKVREAIAALEQAKKHAEHWAEYETLEYFKHELEEFMSCDNGEAGFEPYVDQEAGIERS